jgi:hypothetical protein
VAFGVIVTVGVTVVVTVCAGCGDAVEVPLAGEVPELPAVSEADTDTEKVGTVGAVVDGDEVHAASATGASRVSVPQHSAVSFTPSVVPRTFMDPPHAAGS